MHVQFRNVNDAFRMLVTTIHDIDRWKSHAVPPNYPVCGLPEIEYRDSRNGPVIQIAEPVTATYTAPRERVLFNIARDANPFFHLVEALWMLCGRNDLATLEYFAKQIGNYSDNGVTLNGAYGHRWRHMYQVAYDVNGSVYTAEGKTPSRGIDQLDMLIRHLSAFPDSRRGVLGHWNAEDSLDAMGSTMPGWEHRTSLDVPCNTHIYFSTSGGVQRKLHMTVLNRSNDMIWGMLGANYVHFSFLMEYVTLACGYEMGTYNHITNNCHVYRTNWEPEKWLKDSETKYYGYYPGNPEVPLLFKSSSPEARQDFDREAAMVLDKLILGVSPRFATAPTLYVPLLTGRSDMQPYEWQNIFIKDTVIPAVMAFHHHKVRNYPFAFDWCRRIEAWDWRAACTEWIKRRESRYDSRFKGKSE
jgi:thymidylate synthase